MHSVHEPGRAVDRVLPMIWLALLGSLCVYAGLAFVIEPAVDQTPAMLLPAFLVLGCAQAGLSFAVPALLARVPVPPTMTEMSRRRQTKIAQWAICESIGVLGLVLYVLGAGASWLWGFCAAAALLLGVHAPRNDAAAGTDSRDLARADIKIG